jgi:thiamine-phosphate pyrophosphorylase
MEIIIISPEKTVADETSLVNLMFEEGLQKFHLRKPSFTQKEMKDYLSEINPIHYNKIVLHSHYVMALEFGLAGAHYTYEFRNNIAPQALYDHRHEWHEVRMSLSTSYHEGDDFSSSKLFDYAFYSPVANSISKRNRTAVDPIRMMNDLTHIKTEIIALGGMCPETIKQLPSQIFTGVAILGYIWEKGNNPVQQFNTIKESCHATVLM